MGAAVAVLAVVAVGLAWAALSMPARGEASPDRTLRPVPVFTQPPAESDATPTALFIGDSFTFGTGVADKSQRWTTLVSQQLGWIEINEGLGGTGYVKPSGVAGCGRDYCPFFREHIEELTDLDPDIIIISGGQNDGAPSPDYRAVVDSTFAAAKQNWPGAELYVTSPVWNDGAVPRWMATTRTIVSEAATAAGFTYMDIGDPLLDHPEYVVEDGHPNAAGYRATADSFLAAWQALG